MRAALLLIVVGTMLVPVPVEAAPGNGFDPRPIIVGPARQELKRLPIHARPYRPLHVYGNAVRLRHHRATAHPAR